MTRCRRGAVVAQDQQLKYEAFNPHFIVHVGSLAGRGGKVARAPRWPIRRHHFAPQRLSETSPSPDASIGEPTMHFGVPLIDHTIRTGNPYHPHWQGAWQQRAQEGAGQTTLTS